MRLSNHILFWLALGMAAGALAQTPCNTVNGEQILAGDLARAVPAFAKATATAPLAPTPLPGSTRVFSASELQSLALRFAVTLPVAKPPAASEVCFTLALKPLSHDSVIEALHNGLQIPNASIELLETSTEPVPDGKLVFARENLGTPASPDQRTPVLWRGNVVYAGNRKYPIWAKVRITAPVTRIVAAEALRTGTAIKSGQLREETVEVFPSLNTGGLSIDRIAGMLPIRPISAGAEIRTENLTRANEVNRGDMVQVEVRFGGAHLATTAKAESAGRVGDMISVRNTESNKVFRALVQGSGKVAVGPTSGGVIENE